MIAVVALSIGPIYERSVMAADANCLDGAGEAHYFAGYLSHTVGEPNAYEGASALLKNRTTALCTNWPVGHPGPASSAWVMIAGSTGTYQYAQSGYWYQNGLGCMRMFTEYSSVANEDDHGQTRQYVGPCVTPGQVFHTWEQYDTRGWINTVIDGYVVRPTPWSPYDPGRWTLPFIVELLGETYYLGSDVPGRGTTPSDWSSTQVQLSSTHMFVGACNNIQLDPEAARRYAANAAACDHFHAWTI